MKKTLSTLMILVMMICFNTHLHVSAKGLTVMKYGAIAVLHSIELIYVCYQCYAYGIKEIQNKLLNDPDYQTREQMQDVNELKRTVSVLQNLLERKSNELQACKKGPLRPAKMISCRSSL